MEIRQLETFVHVAQLQSFSRAAEVLGYTQSEKSLWGMQAGSYMT